MTGWRTFYLRLAWSIVLALTVALLLAAALAVASWVGNPAAAVTDVRRTPMDGIRVGTPVAYEIRVRTPYYRLPLKAVDVTLPEGVQLLTADAPWHVSGVGWLSWSWSRTVVVQPFEVGMVRNGTAALTVSSGRPGNATRLDATLPGFEAKGILPANDHTLRVAPEIPASWIPGRLRWWHWLGLAVLVLALALALSSLFRRNRGGEAGGVAETAWESALRRLLEVEMRLPLSAEEFFVVLPDILRDYCEERFEVRAAEATTPECLEAIRRHPDLPPPQRQALGEFLLAADVVKFAKGDATVEQMREALKRGRQFVTETIPAVQAAPDAAPTSSPAPPAGGARRPSRTSSGEPGRE